MEEKKTTQNVHGSHFTLLPWPKCQHINQSKSSIRTCQPIVNQGAVFRPLVVEILWAA